VTQQLDCDGCEGTDKRTAEAIDVSLKKIDPVNGPKTKLNGLSTDAGGGRTSFRCSRELNAISRTMSSAEYFTVTCCLHAHSLSFKCPVEKLFLLGGLKKRTLLQMLYTIYGLQEEFDIHELRSLWKKLTGGSMSENV